MLSPPVDAMASWSQQTVHCTCQTEGLVCLRRAATTILADLQQRLTQERQEACDLQTVIEVFRQVAAPCWEDSCTDAGRSLHINRQIHFRRNGRSYDFNGQLLVFGSR